MTQHTDRELLELAAKAAGKRITWYPDTHKAPWDLDEGCPWNPITDDGDALRLAVKLRMEICVWNTDTTVLVDNHDIPTLWEPANGDNYAATRRAIVRAAAEVGRSME